MRRTIFLLVIFLVSALAADAQIKTPRAKNPDDEGLHYVVLREAERVNQAFLKLNERIGQLERQLAEMRQENLNLQAALGEAQKAVRETDGKVGTRLVDTDQKLVSLRSDLLQVRSDLATLIDLVKRNQMTAGPVPVASDTGGSKVEGYIMEVSEREVKISLGSAQGSVKGWRLGVFAAADPKTQIGQLVVTDVIDANNSRAEIILMSPGARFQFSDIVRPIT